MNAATTPRSRPSVALRLAAAALVMGGCTSTGTAAPASPAPPTVTIHQLAFHAPTLTIHVGQSVTWTNDDNQPHTVTGDAPVGDSGLIDPQQSHEVRFTAAGHYSYHCSLHPFMTGVIVVGA